VLGLLLSLPKILTMLQMLIFLGVINAAFIFPIVLGLWSEKTNPNGVFVAAIVATIGGYVVYFTVGHLQGIIAGGWLSFLITAGSTAVWPREFNWRKLQQAGKSAPEGGD
jgi:Na+/pantothenate symporter